LWIDTFSDENACFKVERVVLNALAINPPTAPNFSYLRHPANKLAPSAIGLPSSSEKPIHHRSLDHRHAIS
jgi:hypothetical protein